MDITKFLLLSGTMHITFPKTVTSWHIKVTFTAPITELQVWDAEHIECLATSCEFDNKNYDGNIHAGETLNVPYLIHFPWDSTSQINGIELNGVNICGNVGPTSTTPPLSTTTDTFSTTSNNQPCCEECLEFGDKPPYWGTTHSLPNVILSTGRFLMILNF